MTRTLWSEMPRPLTGADPEYGCVRIAPGTGLLSATAAATKALARTTGECGTLFCHGCLPSFFSSFKGHSDDSGVTRSVTRSVSPVQMRDEIFCTRQHPCVVIRGLRACVRASVRACISACVHAYLRACVRACIYAHACARVRVQK